MSQQQQSQLHNSISNSSSGKQRNNGKGKFLTRSHALHDECTSPPQTPTPRAGNSSQPPSLSSSSSTVVVTLVNDPSKIETNTNKMSSSLSPITVNATNNSMQNNNAQQSSSATALSSSSSTTTPNMFAPNGNLNVTQLDLEFPKLTPPKSKSPRNNNNVTNNNNHTQHSGSGGSGGVNSNSDHSSTFSSNNNNEYAGDGNGINRECVNEHAAGSAANTSQHAGDLSSTKCSQALDVGTAASGAAKGGGGSGTGNLVSCTILLNDVEKKCDLMLQGSQQNCIDENFSDKDKSNAAADETSTAVEFVYKKNRNSSVTKSGGGNAKSRQKQNYGYDKSNSNNVGALDTSQSTTSNGCQSDYFAAENSIDHFTDQSGVDLLQFFKITLNKNAKDRYMLLRIEKELAALTQDQSRDVIKFPTMSSYNRMLIHRVAAWFGMEHNVDSTVQCVIVNTTKATRLPEIRFKSLLTDTFSDETPSRKSILKRDAHSFEEYRQGLLACPDRGVLDRKAKSFEEREQEYDKTKRRIFKDMNSESLEQFWNNWHSSGDGGGAGAGTNKSSSGKNSGGGGDATDDGHSHPSQARESRHDGRPNIEKSHSFGGYGPQTQTRIGRGDSVNSAKSANLNKQDSNQQTWRLSPSSSGYKTQSQSQSLRSSSVTPSPSYGSASHTPEPIPSSVSSGIVWAVTDMASVPKGSVLIDPQTLKPLVNQDGTIYHFDPSNLPPCTKLQIPNASPAKTPSPTLSVNDSPNVSMVTAPVASQQRKKNHNKPTVNATLNVADDSNVAPRTSEKCDRDHVSNASSPVVTVAAAAAAATVARDECIDTCTAEMARSVELEVILPEPTKDISMNSLLSPLNQTYQDTQDNNLDRPADDNCSEVAVHLNVKSQSTSPNIPCDSETFQLNPSDQSTPSNVDDNLNQSNTNGKGSNSIANQMSTDKPPPSTSNSSAYSSTAATASATTNKKDEIKIVPAVVPVLSYTTAAPPNIYPQMESGVQFVTGTQPTQPTSFPTTYQQGLDGSIYAVPQPMIYGYPTVENEYSGGIFVPMYDQSGAQVPVSNQPSEPNATTTDYRRNCGVPLAFFEPPSTAMAVVPVAYPATSTATPYAPSHNIYQGQILYTSDQYNPATASNNQVPQYINYPVGYTYPYNGAAAYPYWGQAMTYYVPQTMQTQTAAIANNTTNANSNNNNDSNGNKTATTTTTHIQSPHSIQAAAVPPPPPSHPNTVVAKATPIQYAPNSTNDSTNNKSITTPNAASQPNVFQYPPTMTSAPSTSSSTSITNATTTTNATNHSVVMTSSMQSLPNTPVSVSSSSSFAGAGATGNENPKLIAHINTGHPSHRTKNHQALLSTPNDSLKANSTQSASNIDEPDSKEFSNHSSSNYERKKNLQNSNRKSYGGGGGGGPPYRGVNPNIGMNNAVGQATPPQNPNIRKGPLIHHPIPEASGNTHAYTSGAGHHGHAENTPPAYNRVNSTPNSSSASQIEHNEKRPINHNKPLIATLPTLSNVHNHFDRTRAPRPKPLDLRRNASNRNTPSTNSTESNNSPNSIVSSDQHHSQNHHQQHQPAQIQSSSSYASGTVNTSIMSQTGIQPNIGPRVVRMYHGDISNTNSESLASPSPALCGEPFAYNPHSGMYIKFGKTYFTHSMAFPNKAQQNDIRQSLPPITGIYPTMNMMLTGYPAAARPHTVGPRPSHVNPNFNKNNRTPR